MFQLIVIDWSTIKFFHNDFARRFSVMLRSPQDKMIFEASTGVSHIHGMPGFQFNTNSYTASVPSSSGDEYQKKMRAHYKEYKATTPDDKQKGDWDEFMQQVGNKIADLYPVSIRKTSLTTQFMRFLASKVGILEDDGGAEEFGHQQLKAHLQTFYDHVELVQNSPYLYQNGYTKPTENAPHFIVSQPKHI